MEIDHLLRTYRVGHACSPAGALRELARQAADAEMIDAATLSMSRVVSGYIGAGALTRDPASTRTRYAAGRASR